MDLKKLALGMVAKKLGGNNALVGGVMDSLLGGGDKMDIGSLVGGLKEKGLGDVACLLYTSPSPRDLSTSRMPSSA